MIFFFIYIYTKKSSEPSYYNKTIRKLKTKCRYAHKKRKISLLNLNRYRHLRNQLNRSKHRAHVEYLNKLFDDSCSKNYQWKKFYNYLRSKKRGSSQIPVLKSGQITAYTSLEKANLLNSSFVSVFSKETCDSETVTTQVSDNIKLFSFSSNDILRVMNKLKRRYTCGPDGLCSELLFIGRFVLCRYFKVLFDMSINNGYLPSDWKKAIIVPLYKSGTRSDPLNYRPISLTSVSCKIFEQLISNYMRQILEERNFFYPKQFGFRPGYSCESALASFVYDILDTVDTGGQVDCVFIDFCKAFDVVPHSQLILKINDLDIDPRVKTWARGFLLGRSQCVRMGDDCSAYAPVSSGVPQGSVLGPLAFLIFINDIANGIGSCVRLFADDCMVYRKIRDQTDCMSLQSDLVKIESWVSKNKMRLNAKKSQFISFGSRKILGSYNLDKIQLNPVNTIKYLGVLLHHKLNWTEHVNKTMSDAMQSLNFVMRNLRKSSRNARIKAYLTLVRPALEYCASVWHPRQQVLTHQLEMVQRKASRWVFLDFKHSFSPTRAIGEFGWPSLSSRREFFQKNMFYKIYNHFPSWSEFSPLLASPPHRSRHDHMFKIKKPFWRSNVGLYSFVGSGIEVWNKLGFFQDEMPSLNMFKSLLRKEL